MKRWVGLIIVGLVLAAGLFAARPAYAANCADDKSVFGGSYALAAGDELDGNLTLMGGNASVAEGATVKCALVIMGGNADISGNVDGDVVVFGGNVTLHSTAVVGGKLVSVGGAVTRDEGAVVAGGESQGISLGDNPQWLPFHFDAPFLDPVFDWYQGIFETFITAIVMGLLALLIVVFWPEQTSRVAAAITVAPGTSGGLGLLTLVAVPVLLLAGTITICLIPVAFVGGVIFAAAILFSWITLGQIVGARLATALNLHTVSPAAAAGLGTGILWIITSAVGAIPCVGWVAWVVLSAIGLGAVTLTRFGTRPYLGTPTQPPATPPAPAQPQEALPPAAPEAGGGASSEPDLSAL